MLILPSIVKKNPGTIDAKLNAFVTEPTPNTTNSATLKASSITLLIS